MVQDCLDQLCGVAQGAIDCAHKNVPSGRLRRKGNDVKTVPGPHLSSATQSFVASLGLCALTIAPKSYKPYFRNGVCQIVYSEGVGL